MTQQILTMGQVDGPIPFIATWDKEPKTYDPRTEGHFAVVNLSGKEIELGLSEQGYKQTLSLSYGSVGTPRSTMEQVVADLALTIARYPASQSQLSIVKLPCVFSTHDGWVNIEYTIPMDLLHEAIEAAGKDQRFGGHFWTGVFERKYKLR